jgi:hypothetical protein
MGVKLPVVVTIVIKMKIHVKISVVMAHNGFLMDVQLNPLNKQDVVLGMGVKLPVVVTIVIKMKIHV